MSVVTQHKFPGFRKCRRRLKSCKFSSSTRWLKFLRSCRAKTSAKDPEGTDTRGSSQNCGRSSRAEEAVPAKCSRIPTTGAKDPTMQKDPNVSPQSNHKPSAKTRLTMSSHERQPTKRFQECLKHERESVLRGSTTRVDRSVSTHMSESRRAR